MLEDQVLESQDSKSRNNDSARNSESEHKLILNETSPNMKQFMLMKYRCGGSPRVLTKSILRRHKNLFRYKINKSLNFEIGSKKSDSHHLSNASLNSSFDVNKPSRNLSRSAKIMKALSFDRDSFYHRSSNIKKSLTFDSTPSPTGNSSSSSMKSFHANSKISTPSPSPILDNVLRLSTSSNDSSVGSILIASSDSIDENQNRTPQQNRKIARHNSDKSESSNSVSSHSSLRSNLKEKIDEIVLMSNLQSLERNNSISKAVNYDVVTSTPRNLFHEFDEIDCDRPHTPENMIRLIPESMSAIKKSHKKERSYRHREQSAKQQNISIRTQDLNTETIESSEIDDESTSNNCNMSFISEESTKKDQPQKKNTNVKKMLVYNLNNEFFNIKSSSALKDAPKNIDSDDACTSQENLQNSGSTSSSSSHYEHKDKENDSNTNVSKEKECQLLSQKESSNDNNADVMEQGNKAESSESNPTTPPNVNRVVTPKNHENILQHIFTESIKKSHRKVKHENRKSLFKSMIFHHETTISKLEALNQSTRDGNDNQYADINSTSMNETCNSSLQNSARSHTPENVNSSRLLLSQFLSVKKSHRKNKNKKLIQKINKSVSSSRCHDEYHERERNVNLLQDSKYKQNNISKILYRDESHELKESFSNISPIKKTKTMNISLQSNKNEFSNSSTMLSPECEDEFRIYTPIRRKRMSSAQTIAADCVCADETSLEKYNSAQMSSKEVDFSRCETPIARCSYRSNIKARRSESSTRKEHANIDKSENDAIIIADNESENITYDENGRSTPLNMSTTELLSNMNSIKKSHKKNKYDGLICKRRIFEKEQSYTEKTGDINMEKRTIPSLKLNLDDDICSAEMGVCSNKHNDNDKEHETTNVYDDSQPSTSGKSDGIESKINAQGSKLLNTTPPNSWNTVNFIKLLHTTSIKRSHKKERHHNAQDKYIFMSEEYDLSDDGSIFDEEDRLNSIESFDPCQDNNNEEIRS